jgi:L,D-transpeptidase ErfK/SrfK
MDSLVKQHNTLSSYTFTEHHLVRANPWLIENLQNTDYYRMMARDSFVYNQKDLVVLEKGCMIQIPSAQKTLELENAFKRTTLDINIPEFKLRIIEDSNVLYSIPIRVGKNEKRFLKMSGKIEDLRTKTGEGVIINYIRNPRYVNPVNNHEYFVTRRDDNKLTKLPQIPFIETEINGFRYGQLIHPTTNPATLGKASSNGCIGTSEADAWLIYYYAPIGTNINIRYDLTRINTSGDTIVFKDIYTINKSQMD